MKNVLKIFTTIVTVILLSACMDEPEERSIVQAGDRVPDFTVMLDDGSRFSTEDLAGRESVIMFFTTGCSDCRRALAGMQQMYEREPSLQIICISREEGEEAVARYWREHSLTMAYSAQEDRRVYNLFAHSIVPRIYYIGPDLIVTREATSLQ